MAPDRKKIIEGTLVEEYYWAGKVVVYLDHSLTTETFDEACKRLATPSPSLSEHEGD